MFDWSSAQYRHFESERTRPAAELLARVRPAGSVRYVVDLGCGPGNSTELLIQRFAHARVLGVDSSEHMLAQARQRCPSAQFELADIAHWRAQQDRPATPAPDDPSLDEQRPDVIYSNAALQWVRGHEVLLPRWLRLLAPGGALAIQVPDNSQEPSHQLQRELAAQSPFAPYLSAVPMPGVLKLHTYYDLLAALPEVAQVDVWHTHYQHPLPDAAAIADWFKGSSLRPLLQALPADLAQQFQTRYIQALEAAYPARSDGKRLLRLPRLFLVAHRRL